MRKEAAYQNGPAGCDVTDVLLGHLGDVSGSSRALRQVRALARSGLRVSVVGFGPVRQPGALVGIEAVHLPPPGGRGPAMFWRAGQALAREVRRQASRGGAARLYLASDLYALPALARAARRGGARLAYDSRELYAALDSSAGRPWTGRAWGLVERAFIRRADVVFTVSDGIADRLAEAYGIARPFVLPNVPEGGGLPAPSPPGLAEGLGLVPGLPLVLYQGLLRRGRGLEALVEAVRRVPGVQLLVVGEGELEAPLKAQARGLGARACFVPFVPPDKLPAYTALADVGVCLIEPLTESLRLSLPNKLFEYFAQGVPVLASPLPEIRRTVEAFGAGVLAEPSDPQSVARALILLAGDDALRTRLAEGARRAALAYAWPPHALRFTETIRALL